MIAVIACCSVLDTGDRNRAEIAKKGDPLPKERFITVAQLQACFQFVGLDFNVKEIGVLASGFASDGKGGINCQEFCNMVQSVGYNLLGHYSRSYLDDSSSRGQKATRDSTQYRRRKGADEFADDEGGDLTQSKTFQQVIRELCDAMITFDK